MTITHFNLTFEALLEVDVTLKEGVLDPAKHSTIVFKENNHPNSFELADDDQAEVLGNDDLTSKGGVRVQNFPIFSGNANGGLLSYGPDSFLFKH
ncbi:hypothetical protein Gohar_022251, partial [Gossypium harknessii]|nr:hypothetical protein [Gossypium harknessii]